MSDAKTVRRIVTGHDQQGRAVFQEDGPVPRVARIGGDRLEHVTPEEAKRHFAEVGAGHASSHGGAGTRHAHMHRTETIDYGIVLEGEIVLILDEEETVCRQGDIVIQRGTNHGWANRSDRNCRIAFILIDGEFVDGLAP